ncbi:MAG: PadR family transcriptional regulator [Fimbriimonas sp.]
MAFKGDLEALILGTLQRESLHGYEIAKRIKEAAPEIFSVGEGRLYPALHRLERDGFVTATWIPNEGKPARKVYSLTDTGQGELSEKREKWEEFARGVAQLLTSPKPEASHG